MFFQKEFDMSDEVQEHLASLKNLFNRAFESRWGFTAVHGMGRIRQIESSQFGQPSHAFRVPGLEYGQRLTSRSGSALHGSLSPPHPLLSLRIGVGFGI
jgi:hypothetical protein